MLLFVFLVAAVAALSLYMELPRVAFESQRMKEELLIERGMEYQRAIKLYVRKHSKYPARIEDLESANGVRFLRRRYIDPMTGKDEWRMIRVGPMGEFLDSVTMKKDDKKKSENTFISEFAGVGQTQTGTQGVTVANRQRQSDQAGAPGSVGAAEQGGQPGDPNQAPFPPPVAEPGSQPGQPGQPGQRPDGPPGPGAGAEPSSAYPQPPGQMQPGQFQPQPYPPVGFPAPGQQPQPGQPGQIGFNPVGRIVPGVGSSDRTQNPYGIPSSSQTGGQVPQPTGAPGGFPTQNQDFAKGIMQMITNPNRNTAGGFNQQQQPGMQGGMQPGVQPGMPGVPGAGMIMGPGIAGVASKFEAEGIKVINERTKYNEWEFIFDVKKEMEKQAGGMQTGMPQNNNPLGPNQTGNTTGLGGNSRSNSSGFGTGSSSGFGNSSGSGFGNPGGTSGNPRSTGGGFGRNQ